MIERYSRPAMKQVWSDENKYQKWLAVELAVCEAWTEEGVIPEDDMAKLRGAQYNHQRMMEIFETTRHDVTAFLTSVTEEGLCGSENVYIKRKSKRHGGSRR